MTACTCTYSPAALALACGLACAAINTAAQTIEVVVTGQSGGKEKSTPGAPTLTGDDLLLRPSSSLGEMLSGLPGVGSSYFGGTASRPTLRGLDGERVTIVTHGASSGDASSLSADHAIVDNPLAAERIEVLRGAEALRHTGAVGAGVIQVHDNRIANAPLFDALGGRLGKALLGWGSGNQERLGAAWVEAGTDVFTVRMDGYASRSDAVRVPNAKGRIPNTQAAAQGAAVGGSAFFEQGYVGASLQASGQNYGSPAEDTVTIQMQNRRMRIEGERRKFSLFNGLLPVQSVAGFWTAHDYQHQEFDSGVTGTTFKSKGDEAKLEMQFKPLLLGWQQLRTDFVADGAEAFVPKSALRSRSLYALHDSTGRLGSLSAAWRWSQAQIDSLGFGSTERFFPAQRSFAAQSLAFNGLLRIGASDTSTSSAQPGPQAVQGLALTAGAARGARIPQAQELYANGEHVATQSYEIGNANLAVEKSTHLELGLQWTGPRKTDRATFTAFRTRYDNFIYSAPTGALSAEGNPVYVYTAAAAAFQGWEWTGSQRMSPQTDISARLSQVIATNVDTHEPLPRIAPRRIGLDFTHRQNLLGWPAWPVQIKWGVDRSTAQNRVAAGQLATAGYTFWHAALTYEQKNGKDGRTLWFAKLDNATNALAYPASSVLTQTAPGRVPLPGRSLRLGMQVSF